MIETISRRFIERSSSSIIGLRGSSCLPREAAGEVCGEARYPACSTALRISSSPVCPGSKRTVMLLARRFTWTSSTPSTFLTARSTAAEQAEQVMPKTSNFSDVCGEALLEVFSDIVSPFLPSHPVGVYFYYSPKNRNVNKIHKFSIIFFVTSLLV